MTKANIPVSNFYDILVFFFQCLRYFRALAGRKERQNHWPEINLFRLESSSLRVGKMWQIPRNFGWALRKVPSTNFMDHHWTGEVPSYNLWTVFFGSITHQIMVREQQKYLSSAGSSCYLECNDDMKRDDDAPKMELRNHIYSFTLDAGHKFWVLTARCLVVEEQIFQIFERNSEWKKRFTKLGEFLGV